MSYRFHRVIPALVLVALSCFVTAGVMADQPRKQLPSWGVVAYTERGVLKVVSLPDGTPRILSRKGEAGSPEWSPSGEWLLYTRSAHRNDPNAHQELWVVRKDGRQSFLLESEYSPSQPARWSPKVDMLACYHDGKLCLWKPDNRRFKTLVAHGAEDLIWSPDGRWIAFERTRVDQSGWQVSLWRIRVDGSTRKRIYKPQGYTNDQPNLACWSPDSRRLLFWSIMTPGVSVNSDGVPLYDISVNGGKPRRLTGGEGNQRADDILWQRPGYIAFSPNGRRLALAVGQDRIEVSNKWIELRNYPEGRPRNLTGAKLACILPTWSPDGRQIAYVSAPSTVTDIGQAFHKQRIWLMNTDSSGKRRLTHSENYQETDPLWCADGKHLLFRRTDPKDRASLWIIAQDGSGLRRIAQTIEDFALLGRGERKE